MECPKCSFENRTSARFCKQCGQTLQAEPPADATCPACGAANDSDARFCRACGEPLTAAPSATPAEPTLPTSVHIEGGVGGQVAIGNNILQIGDVHGGVVNVMMPEQKVQPKPRPTPVDLRPRAFPNLLDRETEINTATTALQSTQPVEFQGQAGLGKTALLRHLAHHPTAASFPDGVIYLSARSQPADDLLQSLYDAFYQADTPYKPTDAQLKHDLRNKRALVLLDDVALEREDVEKLMDTAPACAFLLGSLERRLLGEGKSVALHGLPPDDALALIEQQLGRALTPQEKPDAQALCTALNGHPLHLIQAAAAVNEGQPLAKAARLATPPDQVASTLSAPERQILAALAALDGTPVHVDHIATLTGLADPTSALQSLLHRGFAQAHSPRYSLTGGLDAALQQAWDLTPWMERALAHFTDWAEGNQQAPDRLLEDADAILQVLKWAAGAGRWADVLRLGRAVEGALTLGGRWAAWIQTLRWMLQAGRTVGDQAAEAWTLHQIGTRALCLGDSATAHTALTKALGLRQALGDLAGAAITQHNLDLLPPAVPIPPKKPPKTRPPLPKWLLPAVGAIAVGGIVTVIGAALLLSGVIPTPIPPPTWTPTWTPTATPTSTPTNTPTATPTEEPGVLIDLDDGCDREYREGDETRITVESNAAGPAKVWLDRRSIGGIELEPGDTWLKDWTFTDMSFGEHEFRAVLMDSEGSTLDEDTCSFTFLPACIDFEDLEVDTEYIEQDTFTSGDASIFVRDGTLVIGDAGKAGGSGNELDIGYALLVFDFDRSIEGLTLRYAQETFETPSATLEINGKSWDGGLLDSASGITLGGVKVTAGDGFFELDGTLDSFMIGGNNLAIDDVCPE